MGAPLLGSAVDVKAKDILSGLTVLEQCSLQNALTKATLGDATELWLMSGGSRADCLGQMFDRERLQAILATVRFEGAAVLACLPPLLDVSYATALLSELDAVVVVVVHHGSRKDLLKTAERLRLLRIPVAGFVYSRMTKHGIGRLDVHLSPAAPDSSARGNELDVPADPVVVRTILSPLPRRQRAGGSARTSSPLDSVASLIPVDVRRRRQNADLTPGTPGDGVADDNGT